MNDEKNNFRKGERILSETSAVSGTILIVEDHPEIIEPLEYSLQKAGFSTLVAHDGIEACRLIGERSPHLVLLDLLLPLLDGWEVCRLVRSLPDSMAASVPIIMLTALAAPQEKFRGLELGADAFLPKPFSIREVTLMARRMVDRRLLQLEMKGELDELRSTEALQRQSQSAVFRELRNQLSIISGFAEVLTSGASGPGIGSSPDCAGIIRRSANYLATLADEFLLVRHVEEGRVPLPLERVEPATILKEIIRLHHESARARNISLTLEERERSVSLLVNGAGCKIAFSNLIDNAIKYSRMGGSVRVTVAQPDSKSLSVEVADSGPGIMEEERDRIFNRFYRSPRHKDAFSGSGLGLYAARALVEAMGGSLSLAHSGEEGNLFRVRFPAES